MVIKLLIGVLLLTLCCSSYAAEINRPKGKPTTVIVDKRPMKHKEKQQVRKELQSGKKRCYNAYDKKTKRNYLICEGGK